MAADGGEFAIRQTDDFAIGDFDAAAGGAKDAAHDGEQRRFAGAGRAHQDKDFAGVDFERDAGEGMDGVAAGAVRLDEILNLNDRRHRSYPRKTIAGSMVVAFRMDRSEAAAHMTTVNAKMPPAIGSGRRMGTAPSRLP